MLGTLSSLLALSLSVAVPDSTLAAGEAKGAPAKAKPDKPADKSDADKKDDKDKKDEKAKDTTPPKPEPVIENVVSVQPDDLVDKPHEYLGKNVKFTAPFFAFSNLALDYKPAYRSSKTHISILVSKPKKKIPLSELKLAMMTPKEKDAETQLLATLKEGDSLEITGKVFSAALDDPWVEILRLKKIGGSQDDKKADASSKSKINDTKASEPKTDKGNTGKTDNDSKSPSKN